VFSEVRHQVRSERHILHLLQSEPANVGCVISGDQVATHNVCQEVVNLEGLIWAVRDIERPHFSFDGNVESGLLECFPHRGILKGLTQFDTPARDTPASRIRLP